MSRLRALRGTLLYAPGPLGLLSRRVRPRAVVLVYHRVAQAGFDPYGLAVTAQTFERHLCLLKRRWRVVALDTLVRGFSDGDYADGSVAVTFDDGYADNLEAAVPIAARLDVPLTIFVTAGPVLRGEPLFWWDEIAARDDRETLHPQLRRSPAEERARLLRGLHPQSPVDAGRPLSVSELRTLASSRGVTIGAHTVTHPALAALSTDEQYEELRHSRDMLEAAIGRPVTLTSFPFGQRTDVSAATGALARQAGYRAAFTATARAIVPGSSVQALSRVIVRSCDEAALGRRLDQVFRRA